MLATIYQRLSESKELPWRALLLGVIVVGGLMIGIGGKTDDGWHTIYWYGAVLILTAQMSHTTRSFFMGEGTAPWLRVPSWRRHRCCPARLGPGLLHAPRRSAPTPSVLQRQHAVRCSACANAAHAAPARPKHLGLPAVLPRSRQRPEDCREGAHTPTLPPPTLAPHSRPTPSPHTLAPLFTSPRSHPAQPSPTLTPSSHPAPRSHRCQGF